MVDILDAAQTNIPADPTQSVVPPLPPPEPPLPTESVIPTEASGSILSSSSENLIVPPVPTDLSAKSLASEEALAKEGATPELSSQSSEPPKEDLPPMDMKPKKRSINPAMLITVILLLLITLPISVMFVSQRKELADIRSLAAVPKGENAHNQTPIDPVRLAVVEKQYSQAIADKKDPIATLREPAAQAAITTQTSAVKEVLTSQNISQPNATQIATALASVPPPAPATSIPKITLNCSNLSGGAKLLCEDGNDSAPLDMNKVAIAEQQIAANIAVGRTGLNVIPSGAPSADGRSQGKLIVDNVCGTDASCITTVTKTLTDAGVAVTTNATVVCKPNCTQSNCCSVMCPNTFQNTPNGDVVCPNAPITTTPTNKQVACQYCSGSSEAGAVCLLSGSPPNCEPALDDCSACGGSGPTTTPTTTSGGTTTALPTPPPAYTSCIKSGGTAASCAPKALPQSQTGNPLTVTINCGIFSGNSRALCLENNSNTRTQCKDLGGCSAAVSLDTSSPNNVAAAIAYSTCGSGNGRCLNDVQRQILANYDKNNGTHLVTDSGLPQCYGGVSLGADGTCDYPGIPLNGPCNPNTTWSGDTDAIRGCAGGLACSCAGGDLSKCTCQPTGGQLACYHTICPSGYFCSGTGTSAFCINGVGNNNSGNNGNTTSNGGTTTTSTTTALQCVSIVAYKDGNALSDSDLANLKPGDTVTLAYAPGGTATKVRFQVNGGAWNESTMKNANSQFVWDYTLENITSFSIAAQWFDGTNWNQ